MTQYSDVKKICDELQKTGKPVSLDYLISKVPGAQASLVVHYQKWRNEQANRAPVHTSAESLFSPEFVAAFQHEAELRAKQHTDQLNQQLQQAMQAEVLAAEHNRELQQELQQLQQRKAELETSQQQQQQQLSTQAEKYAALTEERDQALKLTQKQQQELTDARQQSETLQATLAMAQQELATTRQAITGLQQQLTVSEQAQQQAQQQAETIQLKVIGLQQAQDELEEQLQHEQQRNQQKLQQIQNEMAAAELVIETLQNRAKAAEQTEQQLEAVQQSEAKIKAALEAAQQAHAVNERRFQNFELCRGFTAGHEIRTGLPHQPAQRHQGCCTQQMHQGPLNSFQGIGHECSTRTPRVGPPHARATMSAIAQQLLAMVQCSHGGGCFGHIRGLNEYAGALSFLVRNGLENEVHIAQLPLAIWSYELDSHCGAFVGLVG